jgi:hypothetical protein
VAVCCAEYSASIRVRIGPRRGTRGGGCGGMEMVYSIDLIDSRE